MDEVQKRAFSNLVHAIQALEKVGKTTAYGEIDATFCPCCGANAPSLHSGDCVLSQMRNMIQALGQQIEHGTPSHRHVDHESPDTPIPEHLDVVFEGVERAHVVAWGKAGARWRCLNCGSHQKQAPWTTQEAHRAAAEHVRRCDMRTREA